MPVSSVFPELTMRNQINLERAAAGKGPVGFVNPVLYENAGVLNDVTKGRNTNCGTQGFLAEPGWVSETLFITDLPSMPFLSPSFRRGSLRVA